MSATATLRYRLSLTPVVRWLEETSSFQAVADEELIYAVVVWGVFFDVDDVPS